jgi:hypothetical protein
MKILRGIKRFAVAFYEALVETRKLQAKSRFAQNGWY